MVDAARLALGGAVGERPGDLITTGALLARNLAMRGTVDDALGQACAEAGPHPLSGGQLLAGPLDFGHDKAIQPPKAGSVVPHPLSSWLRDLLTT